jgi:outer membrane protein assembly factor BamD (BamD/ComL family)
MNKEVKEKLKRLEKAYKQFQLKMAGLAKRQEKILRSALKRVEQEQIKNIKERL